MANAVSDTESTSSFSVGDVDNDLKSELHSIIEIVKQLDDFKPEVRRRPGRPKANPETPSTKQQSLSTPLFSLCNLTNKILCKLEKVQEENTHLKTLVESLQLTVGISEPYLAVEEELQGSNIRSYASVTKTTTKSISKIDSRLDQIEQDSLSTTLRLGGDFISNKINNFNKEATKNHQSFNKSVITDINKISQNLLAEEDVDYITIVGKEKKHLKVKLTSSDSKINILKSFKSRKPKDFFASQYLSKSRAWALFKLKKIKTLNPQLKSVYCYSGSICCQLVDSDKIFHLNNSLSINQFISDNNLLNE